MAILTVQTMTVLQTNDVMYSEVKAAWDALAGILATNAVPTYAIAQAALKGANTHMSHACKTVV